jgi:hypothetical protein
LLSLMAFRRKPFWKFKIYEQIHKKNIQKLYNESLRYINKYKKMTRMEKMKSLDEQGRKKLLIKGN